MTTQGMESPFTALASRNEKLLSKILENYEISGWCYTITLQAILFCHDAGKPISAVRFTEPQMHGDNLVAQFYFGESAGKIIMPPSMQFDFETYLGKKNKGMAATLKENSRFIDLFDGVVEVLESFAAHKGRKLADVRFETACITKDRHIVCKVGFVPEFHA